MCPPFCEILLRRLFIDPRLGAPGPDLRLNSLFANCKKCVKVFQPLVRILIPGHGKSWITLGHTNRSALGQVRFIPVRK
jgi:hypothetical protein